MFAVLLTGCISIRTGEGQKQTYPVAAAITQISPELLIEDLAFLEGKLQSIHPQPFARQSQSDFQRQYKLLKDTLNYPMSRSEFYLRVAPLLAGLRDVHTYVNLPRDQFGDFKFRGEKLFPLAVIVDGAKLYVAADLSGEKRVPVGARITAINQSPTHFLLNVMRTLIAKETLTGQSSKIQSEFSWLLSSMGYGRETYQIEYLWQSRTHSAKLVGVYSPPPNTNENLSGSRLSAVTQATPINSFYGFSELTRDTALLWLNDFNEKPEVFSAFLQQKFALLESKGIANLVIDMRFNSGGLLQNLKTLLAFVSSRPVKWAERGTIKISNQLKRNHQHKTRQRRVDKYDWGLQWLPLEWIDALQTQIWWGRNGKLLEMPLDPIEPGKNYKPQRVWVLTNGGCLSACSFFIASVNHYQLGKTLGERPGSLARFQFAYPVKITLPHSGLDVTLPTMRIDFVESPLLQPALPQQVIERNESDIEQRRDPVLNRALIEAENLLIEIN